MGMIMIINYEWMLPTTAKSLESGQENLFPSRLQVCNPVTQWIRPPPRRFGPPGPFPLGDLDPLSRIWTPFNKAIISF